ncbi:glycosyl hydrolase family 18 protein [Saccharicrinis sp. GN24d3]|uniref:glycosyl hydrolase family 18 protein n=1 Tax=Saccharicrinis sp. GN24d3 TaxID=3458416 RepID=UPI004036AFA6
MKKILTLLFLSIWFMGSAQNHGLQIKDGLKLTIPELNGASAFTIETWIYVNDTWGYSSLIGAVDYNYPKYEILLQLSKGGTGGLDGYVTALRNNDGNYSMGDFETSYEKSQWHHVAFVYNGAATTDDRLKAIIDGTAYKFVVDWAANLPLKDVVPALFLAGQYDCILDETRVWDVALGVDEINKYKGVYFNDTHPSKDHIVYANDYETAPDAQNAIPALVGNSAEGNSSAQQVDISSSLTLLDEALEGTIVSAVPISGGAKYFFSGNEQDLLQKMDVVVAGEENLTLKSLSFDISGFVTQDNLDNIKLIGTINGSDVEFTTFTVENNVLTFDLNNQVVPVGSYGFSLFGHVSTNIAADTEVSVNVTKLVYEGQSGEIVMTAFNNPTTPSTVKKIIPLNTTFENKNTHRVTGWVPGWTNEEHISFIQPEDLTHIYYFGLDLNFFGQKPYVLITDNDSDPFPHYDAVNKFHAKNVKVMACLSGKGGWDGWPQLQLDYANSPDLWREAAKEIVSVLQRYNYDGLDWDIENQYNNEIRNALLTLLEILREEMDKVNPDLLLTFSAQQDGYNGGGEGFDYARLSSAVDWVNMMSYMYNIPSVGNPFPGGATPTPSIDNEVTVRWDGFPREKLNVGIPWFGRTATMDGEGDGANVIAKSGSEAAINIDYFLNEWLVNPVEPVYDGQGYASYVVNDGSKITRTAIHNQKSYKELLEKTKELGCGGISIFQLGGMQILKEEYKAEYSRYYLDVQREVFYDDSPTGITNKKDSNEISCYPNPAGNELFVSGVSDANFEIYNMTGTLVMNGRASQQRIDISSIASGIYVLKVNDDMIKFIKK